MNTWIALALGLLGFSALSLAMERHQEQVCGRALHRRAALAWRMAGALLLALSLGVCAAAWDWSVAIAAWLGLLTFAALAVGLTLAYAPRWLPPLGGMTLTASAVAWMLLNMAGG